MTKFKELQIKDLTLNPFEKINKEWLLITAEKENKVNTMTASWGGFGVIWNQNVVYIFVKKSRYTKQFLDSSDVFSISFYDEEYRKALSYLGTASGRDTNKIQEVGFHITHEESTNTPFFEEANLVITCKKIAEFELKDSGIFEEEFIERYYSGTDKDNFHTMYIGKIDKIFSEE